MYKWFAQKNNVHKNCVARQRKNYIGCLQPCNATNDRDKSLFAMRAVRLTIKIWFF